MGDLTAKQARFVDEYLVDLNATQAAIRAGYKANCARQIASENLSKPYIAAAIAAKQAVIREKTGRTVEGVLADLEADRALARSLGQSSAAITATLSIGKHLGMWPNKLTITDADKEAARTAAAQLGLNEAEVLAEVERELRESRA